MGIWLVGWTLGELAVLAGLLFGHDNAKGLLVIWLFGWTLGGAFVWYSVLWPRIGSMMLQIDDSKLRIKNVLGPLELKREYDRAKVRLLHAGTNAVVFEWDGKERSYGEALDSEDLTEIVAAVRQKYPDICGEPPQPTKKKHGAGR